MNDMVNLPLSSIGVVAKRLGSPIGGAFADKIGALSVVDVNGQSILCRLAVGKMPIPNDVSVVVLSPVTLLASLILNRAEGLAF